MEQACSELGLSMSAAFTIFAKKVGREKRIPFEVSVDPFYSESNIHYLENIVQDIKNGKVTLLTPPAVNGKPFVLGMARIVDAKTFLQIYAASYPNIEMNIELTDKVLTTNNGYYYLCKGKCMFSKERLPGSHSQLTIGELCEKILLPLKPYMSLMLN